MLLGVFYADESRGYQVAPLPPRLRPFGRCPAVSLRPPSAASFRLRLHPPTSFSPPSEFCDKRPALRTPENLAVRRRPEGASLGVQVPSSRHQPAASTHARDPSPELRSVLDVSHVLDGLLRLRPCGFVSPRCHVQGSPFRDLSLSAEPNRVSPALSCPLAVERNCLRCLARASNPALDFRALLPAASAVSTQPVKAPIDPRPSWASPPPGTPSPHRGNAFTFPPPTTFAAMSPPQSVLGVSLV